MSPRSGREEPKLSAEEREPGAEEHEPSVRVAGPHDVAALASLRSAWGGEASGEGALHEAIEAWLVADGERRTTWLAEVDGTPVGMVSVFEYRRMPWPGRLDSRWGYVGNMFVREEWRRRGVGTALLGALFAAAEQRSYARLVLSPSEQGLALYREAGFARADGHEGELLLVRSAGTSAGGRGPGQRLD